MKKTDSAYIAGFVDGEGSIGFMAMGQKLITEMNQRGVKQEI